MGQIVYSFLDGKDYKNIVSTFSKPPILVVFIFDVATRAIHELVKYMICYSMEKLLSRFFEKSLDFTDVYNTIYVCNINKG